MNGCREIFFTDDYILGIDDGTSTNVTHLRVSRLNMYSKAEI
jgi:hypothetical protein